MQSKTDTRGKVVTYETDLAKDTLTKVTDPNGQSVNYSYDSRRRVTSTSATADGKTYKNTYTYNNDRLKTVSHNTTSDTPDVTYTFDYDRFGNPTTVKVGNQVLSTNVYTYTGDRTLMRVEYGSGGQGTLHTRRIPPRNGYPLRRCDNSALYLRLWCKRSGRLCAGQ